MLANQTTGQKPAPKSCKIVIPKDKLPLLLAELAKAGLMIPAEYVTADNFLGMLDSAVLTLLAAKGQGDADTSFFDNVMEAELGENKTVREDTASTLFH